MDTFWLNVRFGVTHLQWERGRWLPQLRKNWYWQRERTQGNKFKRFEIYRP